MKRGKSRRFFGILLAVILILSSLTVPAAADQVIGGSNQFRIVVTLGADLSDEQRAYVLEYFGLSEGGDYDSLTITNADERAQLGGLIADEVIGTHTYSCAVVRPTNGGGIQVKTANMNYVTSNMIASTLSTSGVSNCEVLTVAPFVVSGTGALTGVMLAYESASGEELSEEKKQLANEEIVITGEISQDVGQEQATLVVNDIKIHIVRDQITDDEEIVAVVDEVIETTERAAAEAAELQGKSAPAKLGEVQKQTLYKFGKKYSSMGYSYKDVQPTLERVTHNITKSTGIKDPLEDTFTTITDDEGLSVDSILLGTDDSVLGDDANINATSNFALGDHPAEPIEAFTGEVTLTEAGSVKADGFVRHTDFVSFKGLNGAYALMDLNGNQLTESIYSDSFRNYSGGIIARLSDGSAQGIFDLNGNIVVPFIYDVVEAMSDVWMVGYTLTDGTEGDYDYSSGGNYYKIDQACIYNVYGDPDQPLGILSREEYGRIRTNGDYINIQTRDESRVTTYDAQFNAVANPSEYYDFGNYDEDNMIEEAIQKASGLWVSSLHGAYAVASDHSGKYGVVDRYGNLVIPCNFDHIYALYEKNSVIWNGYALGVQNGKAVYITGDGVVTAAFDCSTDNMYNYGIASRLKKDDGSFSILAADGTVTDLGTTYSSVYGITESGGMFWRCERDNKYDLLDWHGNVVLENSGYVTVSKNGNYLIAQNGYTSNTLYLINDAVPVSLAESAGGAVEIQAEIKEAGSLEPYTGDPTYELIRSVEADSLISGTYLAAKEIDGACAVLDLFGRQLTEAKYSSFMYYDSYNEFIEVNDAETELEGLLTAYGLEIVPCEYDVVERLAPKWAVGYHLVSGGNENEYDYKRGDEYLLIDTADLYYINVPDVSYVTLTRDQFSGIQAAEDYVNIRDRATESVMTYNSSFEAIASASSLGSFEDLLQSRAICLKIYDTLGLRVDYSDFPDGYSTAYQYKDGVSTYGVVDMNGNIVVPAEFERIKVINHKTNDHGYFMVQNGDKYGYVTEGGIVSCEIKYEKDQFMYYGMAGLYTRQNNGADEYVIVSGDGVETVIADKPRCASNGLVWTVGDKVIDWHGNEIDLGSPVSRIYVTTDSKYILVRRNYSDTIVDIYSLDGAALDEANVVPEWMEEMIGAAPAAAETPAEEAVTEDTSSEESAPAVEENDEDAEADDPVKLIFDSAVTLLETGGVDQVAGAKALLQQVLTMIQDSNPGAAAVLSSAISLMESDVVSLEPIMTLLQAVKSML